MHMQRQSYNNFLVLSPGSHRSTTKALSNQLGNTPSLMEASFRSCFQWDTFCFWSLSPHLGITELCWQDSGSRLEGLSLEGHRHLWATPERYDFCLQKPAGQCMDVKPASHPTVLLERKETKQPSMNVLWHLRAIKGPLKITMQVLWQVLEIPSWLSASSQGCCDKCIFLVLI